MRSETIETLFLAGRHSPEKRLRQIAARRTPRQAAESEGCRRGARGDADGPRASPRDDEGRHAARTVSYSAASIDLAPGETLTETFAYTVIDGFGSFDTAAVTVTVTGAEASSGTLAGAFETDGARTFGEGAMFALAQPEILAADMPIA